MNKKDMPQVGFRLPPNIKTRFIAELEEQGMTVQEWLASKVRRFLRQSAKK